MNIKLSQNEKMYYFYILFFLFVWPSICFPQELNDVEQDKVNKSIEKGLIYLQSNQLTNGSWKDIGNIKNNHEVGCIALPGLALLECGIPKNDKTIQKLAKLIRDRAGSCTKTYDLSLAVMFLEKLDENRDTQLIRKVLIRLAAGQNSLGGWNYNCPVLDLKQERAFLEILNQKEVNFPKHFIDRTVVGPKIMTISPEKGTVSQKPEQAISDNSNTQFAILALWRGKHYDLPLGSIIMGIEHRFRSTQQKDGWGYHCFERPSNTTYSSMTCVGILALALGHGWNNQNPKNENNGKLNDKALNLGFIALVNTLEKNEIPDNPKLFPGEIDLYYLWTLERTAVLCNLKKIGGKDWYRWGVNQILPAQKADGSWKGGFVCGNSPVIATSMALLFLKKSDLMPGLREVLQQRITITDPGATVSPGEKGSKK